MKILGLFLVAHRSGGAPLSAMTVAHAPQNQSGLCPEFPALSSCALQVRAGFSLIELLVVIAIILAMTGLLVPAVRSMKGAGDLTKATYDIAGALDNARAYAMANNTFVWVGFEELDANTLSAAGAGHLVIATVACKDGSRGYDAASSLNNPAWRNYNNGNNFVPVGKIQHFTNIHLAASSSAIPNSGHLTRPVISAENCQVGSDAVNACATPFDWPLGKGLGSGQYSFKKILNFDPRGIARIQYSSNSDSIPQYIEIGLQPTNGSAVNSGANVAVIQVDCMTGATHIYRP